jgi:hypothetical protein
MRLKKTSLSLECVLTDEEKLNCSKLQNDAINLKTQAEAELKSFSTQKKAEIASADAVIALYYQKISTGKEYRMIPCEIRYDFDKKEKLFIRTDTGEIAKQDIISESELQEEMDIQAKAQEEANEKAKSDKKK